ncbi:hypothetical protein Tco_0643637 [Tanacetum coccineum]
MDGVDVEDLTIKQYLRLTQESQTPKKIEDMTITEYLEYEKLMNMNNISNAKSYLPTYFSEKEKDDVDKWLNAEITKHMSMQRLENMNDALITIIKSIKQEMKDDIIKNQFEASTASVSDETSSIASNEVEKYDNNTLNTTSCRLPKELRLGSFLLPFNIDNHNFYAITTLDAMDNIVPLKVYEYLGLDKFIVIKMADDAIILGIPFLKSTRAQIDVFNEEISFEIGSEKFKFSINSHQCIEKIYMVDIGQEEETFNPLEIRIDLFSYESPACLEVEQRTRVYGTPKWKNMTTIL